MEFLPVMLPENFAKKKKSEPEEKFMKSSFPQSKIGVKKFVSDVPNSLQKVNNSKDVGLAKKCFIVLENVRNWTGKHTN